MDPLAFYTWNFVLFSLGIAAIMFVFRTIVEYTFPKVKVKKFWNELLLPILPIIFGGISSILLKLYPFTTGLTSVGDHLIFGIVAGLISGLVYKVTKGMLLNKLLTVV